MRDYNVFISTKKVIYGVPTHCGILVCPVGTILAYESDPMKFKPKVKGIGFHQPETSPLGWYQSLFKANFLKSDFINRIYFDNEPPILKLPVPEFDEFNDGVLRITKDKIHELKLKYPACPYPITQVKLDRDYADLFSDAIECSDNELYLSRYIPNMTMRILFHAKENWLCNFI